MEMNNSTSNLNITESFTDSMDDLIGFLSPVHICLLGINVLLGFPTHICVIWLIITRSESGIALEFVNLNLSVCETGICLNCLFQILYKWFPCLLELINFFNGLSITGRPLFQCVICVERYLAVVYPVIFLKYKPLRYRLICCTVAWIISLGSCFCCLFIMMFSTLDIFSFWLSIQFLIFLSIQLFCCLAVLRALKQSGPGERGREREEENHMKRKAFHIILITTLSTILAYIPSSFSGLFMSITQHFTRELFLIGFACFVLAGFFNPVLYLHRAGKLCCFSSP